MKTKLRIFILIFSIILFGYCIKSNATISTESKQVNSGEQFSVTVTSDVPLVSYKVQLTGYSGLQFVTSSGGTGAGGTTISNATTTGNRTLATFEFKAPDVSSDTQYTISFSATEMGDENLNSVGDSSTNATITVKAPANTEVPEEPPTSEEPENSTTENSNTSDNSTTTSTKSSDARLRRFGIEEKEYDFSGFSKNPNQEEWRVSTIVPNEITELNVYATPRDKNAKVSGDGKVSLKEGENIIKVTVTAEDGKTTKTYRIIITRAQSENVETTPTEDPNATETPDNTETEDTFGLESLSIKNFSISPKFSTDEYEYTVGVTEDLSSLEIEAKANKENATVEILGNENLQQGENTITILVTDPETEQTATYQIVVNKNSNAEVVAQVNWLDPSTWGTQQIIIVVVVIVLILVIVGVIIAKVKLAKRNVDEELEFPGADELDKAMAEHQELSDEESFPYKSAEGNNEFEKDFMSNSNNSSNEEKYSSDSLFDNSTINTENDNVTTNDYYNNHDENMHTYDEKESKYHLFDDVPSTSNDNDLNDYDTSSRRKGKHF